MINSRAANPTPATETKSRRNAEFIRTIITTFCPSMALEDRGPGAGGSGERRLTAEYIAARVLLDATSIEEAASRILQAICESLGWEHGALWTVDYESDCLRCAQLWNASASRFPEFGAISSTTTFRRGIGLPGRVWENTTPAWIPDVVADPNFPRAAIAAREGLHAAFGFPIRSAARCSASWSSSAARSVSPTKTCCRC
jgi:hypothetical protein